MFPELEDRQLVDSTSKQSKFMLFFNDLKFTIKKDKNLILTLNLSNYL